MLTDDAADHGRKPTFRQMLDHGCGQVNAKHGVQTGSTGEELQEGNGFAEAPSLQRNLLMPDRPRKDPAAADWVIHDGLGAVRTAETETFESPPSITVGNSPSMKQFSARATRSCSSRSLDD